MAVASRLRVESLEDRSVPAATVDEVYVAALYQTTLGRDPEPDGLSYWAPYADVSRAFVASGINLSNESVWRKVKVDYQDAIGRSATDAEAVAWNDFLRTESYATVANLEANIWGLPEAVGADPAGWAARAYQAGPGRPATLAEVEAAVAELQSGRAASAVAYDILTSPEGLDRSVDAEFLRVFGRRSTPAEMTELRPQVPEWYGELAIRSALSNSDLFLNKLRDYGRAVSEGVNRDDPVAVAADFRGRVAGLVEVPPPDAVNGDRTLDGMPPPRPTRGIFVGGTPTTPCVLIQLVELGVFTTTFQAQGVAGSGLYGFGNFVLTSSRLIVVGDQAHQQYILSARQLNDDGPNGVYPIDYDLLIEFIYFPDTDTARVTFTRPDGSPVGVEPATFELRRRP